MVRRKAGANDAADEKLGQEEAFSLGEVGDKGSIEQAAETDIIMESFMNDMLEIEIHSDGREGSLDVVTPAVNGVNQPIIRGRAQRVKRKYVEALARGRVTDYEQRVHNPAEPANIQMVPKTTLAYPFAVLNDPHPNGRAWLDNILAQP